MDNIVACGAVTELSSIFAKQVLHLSSSTCLHFFPVGKFLHVSHSSSGSCVLYRRCKKRNLCIRGRDSRQFSEATFLLILYCAVISLRIDLFCLDGTLAIFFSGGLAVILYCAVVFLRIDLLCLDRTLANFFEACFSAIMCCEVISCGKSSLPRQNSRHFFTQQTTMT